MEGFRIFFGLVLAKSHVLDHSGYEIMIKNLIFWVSAKNQFLPYGGGGGGFNAFPMGI